MTTHKGKIGYKDVTLAYDDDAKGDMGFRNVTLVYDGQRGIWIPGM